MRSFTIEYIPQGLEDPRHSIRHLQPSSSSNANHCKGSYANWLSHLLWTLNTDLWLNCSFFIGQPVLLIRIFTTSPTAHRGHWQGHWQVMRRLLSRRRVTEFLISVSLQIQVTIFFMMDFCFCLMKILLCQHQLDQRLNSDFTSLWTAWRMLFWTSAPPIFSWLWKQSWTQQTQLLHCHDSVLGRGGIYHLTKGYLGRFSDWVMYFWD